MHFELIKQLRVLKTQSNLIVIETETKDKEQILYTNCKGWNSKLTKFKSSKAKTMLSKELLLQSSFCCAQQLHETIDIKTKVENTSIIITCMY